MNKIQRLIDEGVAYSVAEAQGILGADKYEEALNYRVINRYRQYADKYFLRSNQILKAEGLNPWVNMQIFIRKGPGIVGGVWEALEKVTSNANVTSDWRVYSKNDGDRYEAEETIINIIAPIQEIMELETLYLGIISYGTSVINGKALDLKRIRENVEKVVELAYPRLVFYFGARHWHWEMDYEISKIAMKAGCSDCSTDNGAKKFGKEGIGTIPHALENIYAYYYGVENAVVESTKAFDRYMSPEIPRIALIDYANKEITDTITLIREMGSGLYGVRVDTCGENFMQGATAKRSVSIDGVHGVVKAIQNQSGAPEAKVILSSGFGNPDKVQMFNKAEDFLGIQLYDSIGAGFMYDTITATADIIAVGDSPDDVDYIAGNPNSNNIIHKVGRPPKVNRNIRRVV